MIGAGETVNLLCPVGFPQPSRGEIPILTLHDVCRSRYLLYRNLVDCGFPVAKASAAVDVLLDPEVDAEAVEFEPSQEDWSDYNEFCEEYEDRMWGLRIEADDPDYISDRDVMVATGCVG